MAVIERSAIAEGLFTQDAPGGPTLLGGECTACGRKHFPRKERCPFCAQTDVRTVELPRRGSVWSWTTQEYQPKAPYRERVEGTFPGYVLGYVELPGACLVETRLDVAVVDAPTACAIGSDVEFVLLPFEHEDGRSLTTFGFRPTRSQS